MDEVLIRFRLVGDEARALRELSANELRDPRDQARFVLRQELEKRGLLQADDSGATRKTKECAQ
jgi:hypothetical protein